MQANLHLGIARRAILVPLAMFSWLPCGSTAAARGAECVVKEFFAEQGQVRATEPAVILRGATQTFAAPRPSGGVQRDRGPGGQPDPPPDAAELQRREIYSAIQKRDPDALAKALPSDERARRDLLRQTHALDAAFGTGALALVRQILTWDPEAMSGRTPLANSQALQGVARSWQSIAGRTGAGPVTPNLPTASDEVELVRMLLAAGANPDGQGDWLTPLGILGQMKASPEATQAAEMLLRRGATVEKTSPNGRSALSMAAEKENTELVRLMLQSRMPSQDTLDEALVRTPVVAASAVLPLLLERGANINVDGTRFGAPNFYPMWSAATAATSDPGREFMRMMIRYKADPNRQLGNKSSLMLVMHDHELMQALLELKADPNYRSGDGDLALHMAIRPPRQILKAPDDNRPLTVIAPGLDPKVRVGSVALLLRFGADPNSRDYTGAVPLMLVGAEDADIVDVLIARGGRLDLDDKAVAPYGQYHAPMGPVSWSLVHRNEMLASALLRRNSEIAAADCGAVYYAAQTGATRALSALLEHKADAHPGLDQRGMTPLLVAANYGQAEAVRILLERRAADVNEATPVTTIAVEKGPLIKTGGQTALIVAALRGHRPVVEELIRRGADVNRVDALEQTALSYARRRGASDIVTLLTNAGARR